MGGCALLKFTSNVCRSTCRRVADVPPLLPQEIRTYCINMQRFSVLTSVSIERQPVVILTAKTLCRQPAANYLAFFVSWSAVQLFRCVLFLNKTKKTVESGVFSFSKATSVKRHI